MAESQWLLNSTQAHAAQQVEAEAEAEGGMQKRTVLQEDYQSCAQAARKMNEPWISSITSARLRLEPPLLRKRKIQPDDRRCVVGPLTLFLYFIPITQRRSH